MIGDFEETLLMAVLKNGKDAYRTVIYRTLEDCGRKASIGSIYAVLNRLEKKVWLTSREGQPTAIRGGRRKKFYEIAEPGMRALKEIRTQRAAIEGAFDWGKVGLV